MVERGKGKEDIKISRVHFYVCFGPDEKFTEHINGHVASYIFKTTDRVGGYK